MAVIFDKVLGKEEDVMGEFKPDQDYKPATEEIIEPQAGSEGGENE